MKMTDGKVEFTPHYIPWWKQVTFHCVWHGQGYQVVLNNREIQVTADADNQGILPLEICEEHYALSAGEKAVYAFPAVASIRG